MRYGCTGKEFLRYAEDTFFEGNYESAIYLGCVAEDECFKANDYENAVRAMDLTVYVRRLLKSRIDQNLRKRGIEPSKNLFEMVVSEFCDGKGDYMRKNLRELLSEFNIGRERNLPEHVVTRIKEVFKEIPKLAA